MYSLGFYWYFIKIFVFLGCDIFNPKIANLE
jgi:hypothetical protein